MQNSSLDTEATINIPAHIPRSKLSVRFGGVDMMDPDKEYERAEEEAPVESSRFTSTDWSRSGEDVNQEMLERAVSNAGLWAYGVSAVEVWTFCKENDTLIRPNGGYWRDPMFDCDSQEALARLEDSGREDYAPSEPLGPGEGLTGMLWSETSDSRRFTSVMKGGMSQMFSTRRGFGTTTRGMRTRQSTIPENTEDVNGNGTNLETRTRRTGITEGQLRPRRAAGGDVENNLEEADAMPQDTNIFTDHRKVAWRNLDAIAIDPDQPPNERLQLLSEAGFGLVAGVTFDIRGHRGIVVYMARRSVNINRLQSPTNVAYMRSAADLIGAESALSTARQASIEQRAEERKRAIQRYKLSQSGIIEDNKLSHKESRRNRFSMEQLQRMSVKELEKISEDEPSSVKDPVEEGTSKYTNRVIVWAKKAKGKSVKPPPPMPLRQVMWTFFGCFVTMAVIVVVFDTISLATGGIYAVPIPVYASILCLHFGLTAAPAGQPRNVLYGKFLAMTLSLGLRYLLDDALPRWLHLSAITAIVVSAMALLSITHPPAASIGVVFALGSQGWVEVALVLMGDVIAVLMAMWINNLSQKRQYPVYWSLWDFAGAPWKCGKSLFSVKKVENSGEVQKS